MSEFRASLAQSPVKSGAANAATATNPLANDLLINLGWVLTAVVGFFFARDAIKYVEKEKQKTKQEELKVQQLAARA